VSLTIGDRPILYRLQLAVAGRTGCHEERLIVTDLSESLIAEPWDDTERSPGRAAYRP
jgi:hypothetical protein